MQIETMQELAEHMVARASAEDVQACMRVLDTLQGVDGPECDEDTDHIRETLVVASALSVALMDASR